MTASAVLYVGDLERMCAFYQRCFGLSRHDSADGYRGLASDAWLLTLVRSASAQPTTAPAIRRADTPIKLAFSVASIEQLRPIMAGLGGIVDPVEAEWQFRDATHCDCLDPEGNVVQLIQPR